MTKRVAVLASGRGSNFQAVIDAIRDGHVPASCVRLITDNPKAYAIERAKTAGIPCTVVDYESFPSRDAYEQALLHAMQDCNADLIVLAGYMRIVGREIVQAFCRTNDQYSPGAPPLVSRAARAAAGNPAWCQNVGMHCPFR
jgi:phosphoribosylglycinamide formyltransferase-1